jgi:hypothetical protein
LLRRGTISPRASHARSAEDEIPTRRATSLMRSGRATARFSDLPDKLFLLDTGPDLH